MRLENLPWANFFAHGEYIRARARVSSRGKRKLAEGGALDEGASRGGDLVDVLQTVRSCRCRPLCLLTAMCHHVHMKTISIRELHLQTGRWVRHAASRGPIVVTDRGRRVAALQPFDASMTGRPLPNREAAIRKRSEVPFDSVVYQSELREDR